MAPCGRLLLRCVDVVDCATDGAREDRGGVLIVPRWAAAARGCRAPSPTWRCPAAPSPPPRPAGCPPANSKWVQLQNPVVMLQTQALFQLRPRLKHASSTSLVVSIMHCPELSTSARVTTAVKPSAWTASRERRWAGPTSHLHTAPSSNASLMSSMPTTEASGKLRDRRAATASPAKPTCSCSVMAASAAAARSAAAHASL